MAFDLVLLDRNVADEIATLLRFGLVDVFEQCQEDETLFTSLAYSAIKDYVCAIRSLGCGHFVPDYITAYVLNNDF